jgi:hypothetical protein
MPLSLVMAASPNQTKQNGRNQKRVYHPFSNTMMTLSRYGSYTKPNQRKYPFPPALKACLSLSLWQLVQTKPNKMAEIRRGYLIPSPLKALVTAASPNQTKQNSGNQTRVSHPFVMPRMHLSRYGSYTKPNQSK